MLRKYAVTLAALGALNAPHVKALGLGEVTVHSSLNQPLNAEINLLQIRDLTKSQIIAGLADADDFYLAGVKPTIILSDINFQMDLKNGKGVIRLTSSSPIKEPFLNFLVEVNWPSGRLVREYTILLDPPVFSAKDLAPRSAPMAPKVSSSSSASKPMTAPMVQTSGSNIRSRMDKDSQYYVDVRDTLWDIALKTRPDRSVSPQQMMLSIQRMNPDAFVNNNINRLRSGVVLNIPNKRQIQSEDFSQSVEEVKRQNSAWKSKSPKTKASAKKKTEQLDASAQKPAQSGSAVTEEQSQLRIVSKAPDKEEPKAQEEQAVSVDSQGADEALPISEELSAKNRELEEQLVVTLEGLDKVERDNAELFERMEKMTEQLESVQRLLMLKDQQMTDLQDKLVEAQTKAVPPPAPAPVPAPEPSKGLIDTLMQTPAMFAAAGAGLVALLLGLLLFIRKRKQGGEDDQAVEQAMAVLDEREKEASKAESEPEPVVPAEVASTESQESIPEDVLEEVAVDEDPDDPFNLAADEDPDEFDALISDDLDEQLGDDLDMDLKIDEPVDEDPEMAEFAASLLDDEEYDIASDEENLDISDVAESIEEESFDIQDEVSEQAAEQLEESVEEDDDLDFILSAGDDESESEIESDLDAGLPEDDGLDFVVSDSLEVEEPEIESESVEDEGLEESAELETIDSITESDELDSILGEDSGDISDELEGLLEEHDAAESMKMDTVDQHDGEDELIDDGALDDLLNQAEDHGGADEAEATPESESMDLDSLDLDSLDMDADESIDTASLELDSEDLELGSENIDAASDADAEGLDAGLETDLESLDLGQTDELADDLDLSVDETVDVDNSLELADAEMSVPELDDPELDIADETPVEELPTLELDEEVETGGSELDKAADSELEDELNLMLEEDDNELSLEETAVSEDDEELNYLNAADELGTKLDLARAYIDMDDPEGAKDILQEVIKDGSSEQVAEAQSLLDTLQ